MSIMSGSKTVERPAGVRIGKLKRLLLAQLQQGLEPRRLALTLALGFTIGLIPSLWGASLICALLASRLGLNQVIVQVANYLVYPLQILLLAPYFKLGMLLFPTQELPENLATLFHLFRTDPYVFFDQFWRANLQAIGAWLLTTPLLLGVSFLFSHGLIQWLNRRKS